MSTVFESKQISDLLEAEAQRLGFSDKAQPAGMRLRVAPDTAEWPVRFRYQAAALVIADGFHIDTRLFCQRPDCVLLGHIDSVVDYGLKVTPTSRIATGGVMSQATLQRRTVEKSTLVAGGLAAILASTCCLGPLVLVTLGFSGAWIGNLTILEPYRPLFIGAALVALFFAWRRLFRPAQACEPGEVCAVPQVRVTYRIIFWVVVALVLVALVFPYVLPLFY
jgi:mercuric ion transport protein